MRADISNGRFELASAVRVNHAPALNGPHFDPQQPLTPR
jgi:hypothetical protein